MSAGCTPDMWFWSSAVSDTVRAIGPTWLYESRPNGGRSGLRPYGGLKPTTPQAAAGPLIDPPMSDPVASVVVPDARAAADPPEDPEAVKRGFHGVTVVPWRRDVVVQAEQNSGVVERAWKIAPASLSR